jgi:DNA-binding transcriptional ArsR family regulator
MVNRSKPSLNLVFSALANPLRRDVLSRLAQRARTMTELAADHCVSLPAVSRHVKVLEQAGLLRRRREGRRHRFSLSIPAMDLARGWLDEAAALGVAPAFTRPHVAGRASNLARGMPTRPIPTFRRRLDWSRRRRAGAS